MHNDNDKKIIYKIKAATEADIYSHLCACSQSFTPPLHEKIDLAEYSKKLFERALTFEAWFGTSLVGLVAAYLNNRNDGAGFISNVSVVSEFFGRGVARCLMDSCFEQARASGVRCLTLEVAPENTRAIRFYHKLDFHAVPAAGSPFLMTRNFGNGRE